MEAYKLAAIRLGLQGVASSGNVTGGVWVEYIKNEAPPEPDGNFNVTGVRRMAD